MNLQIFANETNNIMENKKPKFKIGDKVRVISLEEANKISYNVESNKALTKYLGKTFFVLGLRLISGIYYYFLKEKTGVCVNECLIESLSSSETAERKPIYSVGQNVIIKDKIGLMNTFRDNKKICDMLLEHASKTANIIAIYSKHNDGCLYLANVDKNITIDLPEKAIHWWAPDTQKQMELDNIQIREQIRTSMIDVDKIVKSPMETWKSMYIDMLNFINASSPNTKAFITGQLYGLTERLMNENLKEE